MVLDRQSIRIKTAKTNVKPITDLVDFLNIGCNRCHLLSQSEISGNANTTVAGHSQDGATCITHNRHLCKLTAVVGKPKTETIKIKSKK